MHKHVDYEIKIIWYLSIVIKNAKLDLLAIVLKVETCTQMHQQKL